MLATVARAAAILALTASAAAAQQPAPAARPESMFAMGKTYVGPRLWLGNINGAIAVGGQIERALAPAGESGTISAGAGIDFYSWSYDYAFGEYSYSVIPLQVFGNYHFAIRSNPKIDPYLGLALVYSIVSASWSGTGTPASANGSTATFAGQGGIRYFLKPNFALQGQIGFGYGTLGVGTAWSF